MRTDSHIYVPVRVHRWPIQFSWFGFITEHIKDTKIVFVHLLTRRFQGYRPGKAVCGKIAALYKRVVPSQDKTRKIGIDEIRAGKRNHKPPQCATRNVERIIK